MAYTIPVIPKVAMKHWKFFSVKLLWTCFLTVITKFNLRGYDRTTHLVIDWNRTGFQLYKHSKEEVYNKDLGAVSLALEIWHVRRSWSLWFELYSARHLPETPARIISKYSILHRI